MAAYLISRMRVLDPERFERYRAASGPLVARFGGRYIARGEPAVLEGADDRRRTVIVEFPDRETIEAFWRSPDYVAAKALRAGAAELDVTILPGVEYTA